MGIPDWRSELRVAQKGTAISFLAFLLETCRIKSAGTGWQYFRQWKQRKSKSTTAPDLGRETHLYALAVYYVTNKRELSRKDSDDVRNVWVFLPCHEKAVYSHTLQLYNAKLVPRYGLYAPTLRIKTVTDSSDLLALLSFNLAYDHRIFPSERQRLDVTTCYLILAYTGCRPAEVVDGEKSKPLDGSWEELVGYEDSMLLEDLSDDEPVDEYSKKIAQLLECETQSRGRPKALCYEDVQLMVIRHPVTGRETLTMSITFIHHKGADNRPKPYVSPSATSSCWRLILCFFFLS